jgi:hypothetical protein
MPVKAFQDFSRALSSVINITEQLRSGSYIAIGNLLDNALNHLIPG